MSKPGYITEDFARRLAALLRFFEPMMKRRHGASKPRVRRGRGFLWPQFYVLGENLAPGDSATATLAIQDADDASWASSEDELDEEDVYLHADANGTIASGCVVIVQRNPATGFLNVIQTFCCPA